jgi:hypothetical protein
MNNKILIVGLLLLVVGLFILIPREEIAIEILQPIKQVPIFIP